MQQIEFLYEEHKQELYSYLLWLTHDRLLAEDLLQETFVQAITSLERFQKNSSVRTWLFSIARHLWLRHLRAKKPDSLPEELLGTLADDSMPGLLADRQTLRRIEQLLQEKDGRTREIALLRAAGYSYAEIAQHAGISENSARVILFRTRTWLKTMLQKEGYF